MFTLNGCFAYFACTHNPPHTFPFPYSRVSFLFTADVRLKDLHTLMLKLTSWTYHTRNFGTMIQTGTFAPYGSSWRMRKSSTEWTMISQMDPEQRVRVVGTYRDLVYGPYFDAETAGVTSGKAVISPSASSGGATAPQARRRRRRSRRLSRRRRSLSQWEGWEDEQGAALLEEPEIVRAPPRMAENAMRNLSKPIIRRGSDKKCGMVWAVSQFLDRQQYKAGGDIPWETQFGSEEERTKYDELKNLTDAYIPESSMSCVDAAENSEDSLLGIHCSMVMYEQKRLTPFTEPYITPGLQQIFAPCVNRSSTIIPTQVMLEQTDNAVYLYRDHTGFLERTQVETDRLVPQSTGYYGGTFELFREYALESAQAQPGLGERAQAAAHPVRGLGQPAHAQAVRRVH